MSSQLKVLPSSPSATVVPSTETPYLLVSPSFSSNGDAALYWFNFGFSVIPIMPGTKKASLQWDPWLASQSIAQIATYWREHPTHEVGFIVGAQGIVFDADGPEAIAALEAIEEKYRMSPRLVVKTSRGVHHHFRVPEGVCGKSDSHDSIKHPARIDVKTGRGQIILPPSTGKTIEVFQANNACDLSEVSQEFIDAVFKHNERKAPRVVQPGEVSVESFLSLSGNNLASIEIFLNHIDPDCGYEDWFKALAAIFHETSGSDAGLALAIAWSRKSSKYPGDHEMRKKWDSFQIDVSNPITIGTLIMMAKGAGMDLDAAREASIPPFEKITSPVMVEAATTPNVLDQYSLMGCSGELEKHVVEQCFVLEPIARMGQMTFFFAPPNSGKTLVILFLLIDAIKQKRCDPLKVYYINVDDSAQGLVEKNNIAEEYGFHMLSEGHRSFSAGKFLNLIVEIVDKDQASGMVIILDTVKKFVDVMHKKESSRFSTILRSFVLKGGTVIGLAHTNKTPGRDGKLIVGGTSDLRDDCDCAYMLSAVQSSDPNCKVVVFENIKSRGGVDQRAAFSYSTESGISYSELICSVRAVDETQFERLKQVDETRSDSEIIAAVKFCISTGVNSKMKLADAVAQYIGVSKGSAIKVIEKYTGVDPAVHHWTFAVKDRGAKVFTILDLVPDDS